MNIDAGYDEHDADDDLHDLWQAFEEWCDAELDRSPRWWTCVPVLYASFTRWLDVNDDSEPPDLERFRAMVLDTFPSRFIGEEVINVGIREQEPPKAPPPPAQRQRSIRR